MKCSVAPFGFTVTPPNGYNRAMIDSASQETPPLFPRFLAGGPAQLRLGPASVAVLLGGGAAAQAATGILGRQPQGGWLIWGESAEGTILGALLTAMLAARWLGRPVGLAAGLLQLTCLYCLGLVAPLGPLDSLVTVLVAAALGIFALANVPGRLAVDERLRMPVIFYAAAAGLLCLGHGVGLFAEVLLPCLVYVLLNQDGRAFRFLIHPLGLGVAAILAACAIQLGCATTTGPAAAVGWGWPVALAVGMLPWWPLSLMAVAAGCRRGDYATSFWRLAACGALSPMVLAAAGLLDGRSALAASCGPVSIFSAAGLHEAIRWWRAKMRASAHDA